MFDTKEFYKLEQRSLIKICGKDKFSFLQGIISNDIENLKKKSAIYSSILSPQGRFISDFFLSNFKEGFLMEINRGDEEDVIKKLNFYKLRSNVSIELEKNVSVFLLSNDSEENLKEINENYICFDDPRFKKFFKRLYVFNDDNSINLENVRLKKVINQVFNDLRLKFSIPDFQLDAEKNKTLLMEMRFDELNGISWDKGCFMGQEITARMKYRNLMKKRIFKIKINFKSSIDDEIRIQDEVIGNIFSHNKIDGLAYIKLKELDINSNIEMKSGDSSIKIEKIWWSKV